jgi:hypothetical protein
MGLGLVFAGGLWITGSLDACRFEPAAPEQPPSAELPTNGPRFFARTADGQERPLTLHRLAVEVTTRPGTVRSHLTMEIVGPPGVEKAEAILRMAIPRGAALTGAVLWVDGHPQNGAFVERERARTIYRSIVTRRRDPALVTWDGPGWIAISIFPLGGAEWRRFELEWVEPAAVADGYVQYRAPTVGEGRRIVARASVTMDGRRLADADLIPLVAAPGGDDPIVDGRAPGDPFHRLLVRARLPIGAPQIVLLAETSVAVNAMERIRQRAILDALLGRLPQDAKVTVLSADWDLSIIAEQASPAEAERNLERLDAIPSAGALHLARALTDAAVRAAKAGGAAVLFVGHGVDGFWGDALAAPLATLRAAGTRLSVIGTDEAAPSLVDVAALTGGEAWMARGLESELGPILRALAATPVRPALTARGLDVWRPLETVTGQTVWIGRALQAPVADGAASVVLAADVQDLLPLWDRARLFTAQRGGRSNPEAAAPLSLTPLRALLVLEHAQDYAREGLEAPPPGSSGRFVAQAEAPPANQDDEQRRAVLEGLVGAWVPPGMVIIGTGGGGTAEGAASLGDLAQIGGRPAYQKNSPYRSRSDQTGKSAIRMRAPPAAPIAAVSVPAEAADADLPATEALAILGGLAPLADRVSQIAVRLSLDGVSDPETLAWTLDRHAASRNRIILIARLLVAAGRLPDAIRVLSEHAPLDREAIGAEMRRLGADADAAELLSLAERRP